MKIAIVGYGLQGQSAFEYWNRDGNQLTICDQDDSISVPAGVDTRLGSTYLHNLGNFDLIVRSPLVHPAKIVEANSRDILSKITTNTNEFFRVCPTKNTIGVTGTKGKGTTSTLIANMLEADGKRVHLGGNIGTPPLDILRAGIQPDDWVVLELANFQLIDLHYSPHIAVCLMLVPEHLDWHLDVDEYYIAKTQLFRQQTSEDVAIYFAANDNSKRVATTGGGQAIPYFAPPGAHVEEGAVQINGQALCQTSELKLLGQHNWQNVCAAVTAVWQITQNLDAIRSVLTSFTGLPFRIELRTEKNGIAYYNDSFASQPNATIAALEAIPGNKVLIIGGFDRGLDLAELANTLQAGVGVRKVLVIGASAERLASELEKAGFTNYQLATSKDMGGIVREASALAEPGDAVVLSPGFPSFDMFKNFEDRGQQFNAAVEAL